MLEPITSEQMNSDFGVMWTRSFPNSRKRANEIIREVCELKGCTVEEVKSKARTQHVAWVRQDCMLALRENTRMSLPSIGRMFNRDHTTVMWGIKQSKKRRAEALA